MENFIYKDPSLTLVRAFTPPSQSSRSDAALECLPKSFPTFIITASQIIQMFVGTGVCVSAWYFMLSGHTCSNDQSNLVAGALMYGSYLYLFVDFAFKRFGSKRLAKKVQ